MTHHVQEHYAITKLITENRFTDSLSRK